MGYSLLNLQSFITWKTKGNFIQIIFCIKDFIYSSPLVLANLWDVTDKDIDMYIKRVLEDSDLLVPIGIEKTTLTSTANTTTIIEKAHLGRQECFLKGLNGYAPIVYGLI